MPTATVTLRELKNKSTGIDLSVPTYKEAPGILGSSVEYHVVVVSILPFFKSAKHKQSDVVQFMISKKFSDFEELHEKLSEKFTGTVLPPVPRKVLRVNDAIARERRNGLDHFLKMIAAIPKIGSSSIILEFLGVNPIKAGKYCVSGDHSKDKSVEETKSENADRTSPDVNVFDEEDKNEVNSEGLFVESEDNPTSDLFSGQSSNSYISETPYLFEDQDYGGGITEEEETNLFLPDPIITTKFTGQTDDDTDTEELFKIEDNLDNIMRISSKKSEDCKMSPTANQNASSSVPTNQDDSSYFTASASEASHKSKFLVKPKPTPRSRPPVSDKPKPPVSNKPKPPVSDKSKPSIFQKPPVIETTEKEKVSNETTDSLNPDDIVKYIQSNSENNNTDLDLFS